MNHHPECVTPRCTCDELRAADYHADIIRAQQTILRLRREKAAVVTQLRELLARVEGLIAESDEIEP